MVGDLERWTAVVGDEIGLVDHINGEEEEQSEIVMVAEK